MDYNDLNQDMTVLSVPTGFLGWGTPRHYIKGEVEVISEFTGSCSASCGAPITFKTKEGEVLHGYEPIG